jgi:hypothetical protein
LLLTRDVLDEIRAGRISVVFRCWRRPTVRTGGTLRTAIGVLAIDAVEPVALADVGQADARRAGFASRAADLTELGLETLPLKAVRKLNELGLTESLEVGYRLSPRGRALVRRLAR